MKTVENIECFCNYNSDLKEGKNLLYFVRSINSRGKRMVEKTDENEMRWSPTSGKCIIQALHKGSHFPFKMVLVC